MQGMAPNRTSTIDVPVRILVPSESVGAIIGKGGQTIRQLTQQTRAKVDVFRGDPMQQSNTLQEKVITIRGQPENCINACREILKVMKTDAENKGKPVDIPLKVLAHNDYIGRIIGKQGNIINNIKKETETTVTVSSISDVSQMNVERVITVKGELENMIKALEIIHQKIKSAFENDQKTFGAQAIMMGGIPPLPLQTAATAATPFLNPAAPFNPQARYVAAAAAAAAAQQSAANGPYTNFYTPLFPSIYPQNMIHPAAAGPHQGPPPPPPQQHQGPPHPPPPQHQSGGPQQQQQAQSKQQQQSQSNAQQQSQNIGGGASQQSQQIGASGSNSNAGGQQQQSNYQQQNEYVPDLETVFLYIPNAAVGAIIGTKGSFIKNIIKLSGASVKITPLSPEESKTAAERQVVITGTPESQYKAQYYIYEKIRQERFITDDNIKLRVELQIPSHIVGRIIGKSGKNVRDLQRSTGATIKLPDDAQQQQQQQIQQQQQQQQQTGQNSPPSPTQQQQPQPQPQQQQSSSQFVIVRIYGTFNSSQAAQRRIQSIVMQSLRGVQHMPSNRYSNQNFQQSNYIRSNGGGRPYKPNRQQNNQYHHQNQQQQQQNQQQQASQSGGSASSSSSSSNQNASSPIANTNENNNGASNSTSNSNQQQQQQQPQNDSSQTASPTPAATNSAQQ